MREATRHALDRLCRAFAHLDEVLDREPADLAEELQHRMAALRQEAEDAEREFGSGVIR